MNISKQIPIDFAFMPFSGVAGTADDDEASDFFMALDMNDDETRRKVIAKFIVPYSDTFSDDTLNIIRIALSYLIYAHEEELLRRGFYSDLPAFALPKDERSFFIEVWEAVFREPFHLDDKAEVRFTREVVNPEYKKSSAFITDNQTWALEND